MKKIITALTAMTILLVAMGYAQDEKSLEIYGFFQTKFSYEPSYAFQNSQNSFNLQQMNIMMRKEFTQDFSAFANFQILNSFNTERSWGTMNLEEAWVKYQPSEELSVKAGMLIPSFNNLNEIKNKTPLLPYIFRPIVYESSWGGIINNGDFAPERAFLQIGGTKTFDQLKMDYAAYLGNSEPAYMTTGVIGATPSGSDTTTFKMVGGRVGIRTGDLKAGISATYDRKKAGILSPFWSLSTSDVPRVRLGGDLSFKVGDFSFEGEMISVKYSIDDATKAGLDKLVLAATNPMTGISPVHNGLDENFGYVNILYDINEKWYVYGGGDYFQDASTTYFNDGCTLLTVGGGFRPIEQIVVKAQYVYFEAKNKDVASLNIKNYNLAVSVLF